MKKTGRAENWPSFEQTEILQKESGDKRVKQD